MNDLIWAMSILVICLVCAFFTQKDINPKKE